MALRPLNKLRTAADLNERLESLKRARAQMEASWKIDLAFYKGKQYTYYNKTTRRLEALPVEDGEKPRYRVRIVNNQIMPGAHSLLAKYTKTKPIISATPSSGSDTDMKAAQVADKLLRHWWTDLSLDDKLAEALLWAIITGQGYWKVVWNKESGKTMRFLLDPSGQPIVDEAVSDAFRGQLSSQGIQPQERVVALGDIDVTVPSPFDVYLDNSAKVFDEAQFVIFDAFLTPEEIKERWDVNVKADSSADSPDVLLPFSSAGRSEASVTAVHSAYFKPSLLLPNGRIVTWVGQNIVDDKAWNIPVENLPLVKFPGVRIPGSIYDGSVVEQAIPLNKDLNRTLSQIVEYKNLTLKPRVWAPTGSLSGTRLTSEPGVVYEYNPIGDHKPEIEKLQAIPPYVFDHLSNIKQSLKEVFGIAEITEGTPPPNVEAGIAIDLLQEMATDRLAPTVGLIERSIARAGELMLGYAKEFYQEPRTLKIVGSGASSRVKRFQQADLNGGVSIVVESGSALPRTRAGRQARILDYIDRGVIRPDQGYKYLDIADLEGLSSTFRADEDQAYREHDRILAGQPMNPLSAQGAIAALQAGTATNDDGSPVSDPQAFVKKASLAPYTFENYQTHLDIHALMMKSAEWENLPANIQADFIEHYNQTLSAFQALPKPVEFQPVRPSLQIKGTVGPTVAAKILNRAGLDSVTPDELLEPPLETWVSDSVDKPNLSDTAQTKVTDRDIQLKQMELLTKTLAASTAHSSGMLDDVLKAQMGEEKLREARARANLAEKQAKEGTTGR